jgi:hypothetical protein
MIRSLGSPRVRRPGDSCRRDDRLVRASTWQAVAVRLATVDPDFRKDVRLRRSAAHGVPERTAGLGHPRVGERRHPSTERSPGDRVGFVDVHLAITRDVITVRCELEFGQSAVRATVQPMPRLNWEAAQTRLVGDADRSVSPVVTAAFAPGVLIIYAGWLTSNLAVLGIGLGLLGHLVLSPD